VLVLWINLPVYNNGQDITNNPVNVSRRERRVEVQMRRKREEGRGEEQGGEGRL